VRILAGLAAAVSSAFVSAIALAVVDLYLSGHGATPLGNRPLADVDSLGVHLSVADGMLLTIVVVTFAVVCAVTPRLYRR
jgi:hypothetical protein